MGWQPLHCAASKCDDATIQLLLQSGADPNGKDIQGLTAYTKWREVAS